MSQKNKHELIVPRGTTQDVLCQYCQKLEGSTVSFCCRSRLGLINSGEAVKEGREGLRVDYIISSIRRRRVK